MTTNIGNTSEAQAKLPDFALGLLSSLGAGSAVDNLFANLLSQTQLPPPPPPDPSPPAASTGQATQTQDQSSQPSQSQQNVATDDTSNNTTASTAPSGNTPVAARGAAATGRHGADKGKSHHIADGKSLKPHPASSSTAKTATTSSASAAAATNNTPPAADDQDNADIDNVVNADAAPAVPATNANAASTVTASTTTATDTPPSSGKDSAGGKTDTSAAGDITAAELLLLLQQLERLAASHLVSTAQTANADPSGSGDNTGQSPDAATQAAQGSDSGTQDKIDLKALLAAIAGLNDPNPAAGTGDGQGTDTSSADAQNTTQVSAAASLQNAVSVSGKTSAADAGNDKWANAGLFNLFNLTPDNQNAINPSPLLNPVANIGSITGGSDDPALDADSQGQTGADARNAAASLLADNNASPLAVGTQPAASPYDFASQLSALRAVKGGPVGLPAPIEQVMLQLSRGLSKDGSSQMTIQLRPAELGRVDVKLNIGSDGKVQGTVTADNSTTLGLLLKDVRGLERALQEAGLRADPGSLQFNLRGDGQSGSGQTADSQSGFTNDTGASLAPATAIPALADSLETYYVTPGGVNMRV